jgi:hypothetical protein
MTNYTHIILTGQVTKFLRWYTNLYRYSNQGWEYQNSQMKYIDQHPTNHVGSGGTNGGRISKMKLLGHWFLR